MLEIESSLAALRRKRGMSAIHLAASAGVSRQTIYAIEAGAFVPNTTVALKLARALDCTVEELFSLATDAPMPGLRTEKATLLPGAADAESGQPVQLCRVDKRLMASAPSPVPWYLPATDAVVTGEPLRQGRRVVQIFENDSEFRNRLLVAGCDPGISVLARHAQAAGVELVLAHRNSSEALQLLKEGCIHIAGTHLRDGASGESNVPAVTRLFPKSSVAVIAFAVWEEGLVTARGNPKNIRTAADLGRTDITIVNREAGAGSRALLDSSLRAAGVPSNKVRGYDRLASGHLAASWQVQSGAADCCVATRAAARLFGLGFVPLVSERYDLVVRKQHLDLPRVQSLLDVLSRSGFRRELGGLGGYDTSVAGQRIL